jgi:hypothetical protein
MKKLIVDGTYINILELDKNYYLALEIPSGEVFVEMPENEKVYPDVEEVQVEEDSEYELDPNVYIIDLLTGEHCYKFVGGRPRNVVRRKK